MIVYPVTWYSVPPMIIAGVTIYVALYNLHLFFLKRDAKEFFYFALVCFSMTFYLIFATLVYNAGMSDTVICFQRGQVISLSMSGLFFLCFLKYYLSIDAPRIFWSLRVYMIFQILLTLFERADLVYSSTEWNIKHITLPFDLSITYYERAAGPASILFSGLVVGVIGIFIWTLMLQAKNREGIRKSLLAGFILLSIGLLVDGAVSSGWINFPYILEYMWLGMIWAATVLLTRRVALYDVTMTALNDSEARYKSIMESIRDIYVELSFSGEILEITPSIANFVGYTRAQVLGRKAHDFFGYPETVEQFLHTIKRVGVIMNQEVSAISSKGDIVHGLLNAHTLERKGRTIVIGSVRDVTAYKKAMEENEELEQRLNQAEKMEALGRLAGGVAHDLNNILSAIVGYPDLVLLEVSEEQEEIRKTVLHIKEAGFRAGAMVQDLLTLTRRANTRKEALDLRDVVKEFLDGPEYSLLQKQYPFVRGQIDVGEEVCSVEGSRLHLYKTVANLVNNAFEAMPAGGLFVLRVKKSVIEKEISGYMRIPPGDYISLEVSDTGVGIESEFIDKIFEPFYTSKSPGKSGTGLGMAIVWGTVKDHSGYIDLTTGEGEGTHFTLFLPASTKQVSSRSGQEPQDLYNSGGMIGVVVDDMEDQRILTEKMLTHLGFETRTFSNGEQALKYIRTNQVHLVLADSVMPNGISGMTLCDRLAAEQPDVKVILMSGFIPWHNGDPSEKRGINAFLNKPFTLNDLSRAVHKSFREEG